MSTRPARATSVVAPRPDVRRWLFIALAFAASVLASTAGAQAAPAETHGAAVTTESMPHRGVKHVDAASAETWRARQATSVGPRLAEGLVAYKPAVTTQFEALTTNEREMNRPASRNNAALIVVGLSAMVLGSVVDGDAGSIIVLGGAGVALYGLWHYLK